MKLYSGLMPASLTTLAHFVISARMSAANSSGEPLGVGSAPSLMKRFLMCGIATRIHRFP